MRAAIFGIYFVLILGAIPMVYPFLITVTGSMSNAYDYEKFLVLPEWTWNREEQFVKYLAEKYRLYRSEIFEIFASAYNLPPEIKSFRDLTLAKNPVKYFKEFHAVENDLSRIGTLYQDYL